MGPYICPSRIKPMNPYWPQTLSQSDLDALLALLQTSRISASSLDVGSLSRAILEEVARLFDAEAGGVFVADEPAGMLRLLSYIGTPSAFANAFQTIPLDRVSSPQIRVLRSGEPYRAADMRLQIRRGPEARPEEVYLTVAYVPLRNPEGKVDAALALAIETTEQVHARRRMEELGDEARRRAAELDAALAAIPNGLAIYDAQARIIRLNAAAEAILGFSPAERERPLAERAAKLRDEIRARVEKLVNELAPGDD